MLLVNLMNLIWAPSFEEEQEPEWEEPAHAHSSWQVGLVSGALFWLSAYSNNQEPVCVIKCILFLLLLLICGSLEFFFLCHRQ